MAAAGAQQDPRMRDEPFRAADGTFLVHEHDRFLLRVDAQPASAQAMRSIQHFR
jgi:hypothetical protein